MIAALLLVASSLAGCAGGETPRSASSSAAAETAGQGYGSLPNGGRISGAPSAADLSAVKATSDEVIVDNLRGMTLAEAIKRLGPLDRIPLVASDGSSRTYTAEPVVKASPTDQPDFSTATSNPWDQLTVTAVAAVSGTFYFGVIPTRDISSVPNLVNMLKERAPMTFYQSTYGPLWSRVRNQLMDQVGLSDVTPQDWATSVVRPDGAGN